jgi:tetratricopeptide (TPR) repeat protein
VNVITFSRSKSDATTDSLANGGYAAYQRGDLNKARSLYQEALLESPRNRDALLGLAAIAVRDGDFVVAMELYSRMLARDPSDPVARAGLLGLTPSGSASEQELELKWLLEKHPDVASLIFALGNFYASQQRWTEAQQTYFNALSLAKADAREGGQVNPDYAFNLAVSLEHLNQLKPAQSYYQEALAYAADYPAGFDLGTVRSRLANISNIGEASIR